MNPRISFHCLSAKARLPNPFPAIITVNTNVANVLVYAESTLWCIRKEPHRNRSVARKPNKPSNLMQLHFYAGE